jgi:hypothetical protein
MREERLRVFENNADENIWTYEGRSTGRVVKTE